MEEQKVKQEQNRGNAKKITPELIFVGVCFVILGGVINAVRDYPTYPWREGASPGTLPMALAVILFVLSLIILFQKKPEAAQSVFVSKSRLVKKIVPLLVLGYTTPWLLGWVGFRLTGVVFLLSATFILTNREDYSKKLIVGIVVSSVAIPLLLYVILQDIALVPLPRGSLF